MVRVGFYLVMGVKYTWIVYIIIDLMMRQD